MRQALLGSGHGRTSEIVVIGVYERFSRVSRLASSAIAAALGMVALDTVYHRRRRQAKFQVRPVAASSCCTTNRAAPPVRTPRPANGAVALPNSSPIRACRAFPSSYVPGGAPPSWRRAILFAQWSRVGVFQLFLCATGDTASADALITRRHHLETTRRRVRIATTPFRTNLVPNRAPSRRRRPLVPTLSSLRLRRFFPRSINPRSSSKFSPCASQLPPRRRSRLRLLPSPSSLRRRRLLLLASRMYLVPSGIVPGHRRSHRAIVRSHEGGRGRSRATSRADRRRDDAVDGDDDDGPSPVSTSRTTKASRASTSSPASSPRLSPPRRVRRVRRRLRPRFDSIIRFFQSSIHHSFVRFRRSDRSRGFLDVRRAASG